MMKENPNESFQVQSLLGHQNIKMLAESFEKGTKYLSHESLDIKFKSRRVSIVIYLFFF